MLKKGILMPLKHTLKSDALGGCLRDGTGQNFFDPTGKIQIQNLYLIQYKITIKYLCCVGGVSED